MSKQLIITINDHKTLVRGIENTRELLRSIGTHVNNEDISYREYSDFRTMLWDKDGKQFNIKAHVYNPDYEKEKKSVLKRLQREKEKADIQKQIDELKARLDMLQ